MEKLQAALDNARAKRQGTQQKMAPGTPATPRHSRVDDRWEDIPKISMSRKTLDAHLVVSGEASEESVSFDILRTKLLLSMQKNGWTRLAITSPTQSSGKSTTAANLALGLGRQSDLRTIVIDLDLSSPALHRLFGHMPPHTVTDVLEERCDFQDQAVRITDDVAVLMSSRAEADPARVLLSDITTKVLDDIQARYEPNLMIFDLPCVLTSDNARAFLKNVDCALIVARAGQTRFGQFDVCEQEVAHYTNVAGVLLNACRYTNNSNDFD